MARVVRRTHRRPSTVTVPTSVRSGRRSAVPTRAAIYRVLRTEGVAHSAREIGDRIGIHANVARAHLDVLVDAGLATRAAGTTRPGGRPAKVYVAREQHVATSVASRPSRAAPCSGCRPRSSSSRACASTSPAPSSSPRTRAAGSSAPPVVAPPRARSTRRCSSRSTGCAQRSPARTCASRGRRERDRRVRSELAAIGEVDAALADALAVGIVRGALAAPARRRRRGRDDTVRARPPPATVRCRCPRRASTRAASQLRPRCRARDAGHRRLRPGAHLEVLTDAAGAPAAYARWADRAGHRILAVDRIRDLDGRPAVRILIRRAAGR
jgi:DNA-binding transcriptional ArsR family regulator/TusA-related sulfurtransferase